MYTQNQFNFVIEYKYFMYTQNQFNYTVNENPGN